ncbi:MULTISPECIES: tRNA (cytidine(34)-2'-O)-methyltransferase [unclassified Nitratiruptor]|uniref:tRNA (cytidine(34)-2'-O)-methyltransferase n=1 Tax=unclassified Nitratiruptor TaxID=2624044 RepID=UPI0019159F8F|nr:MULTISPECIES: tRNA (cytidine(34)-2'-O)-methyltransferase [unclassified Nitratiruptor]BCD60544.1 tRNA (cytidine/uridine-2'-O-)-methyltransferase [Nitratiruptor sp. YY08-10]BCD63967.1 tRNA (cytidine/uridine-2'-O-)-methyltransferase [Nitratiruptor sp. YY08-14]
MFNIVLVHPQIPPNTGNIGRLCVNTGSTLHLVKPLGFDISEKAVKRAGLDYWDKLELKVWDSLDKLLHNCNLSRAFFATTKSSKPYFQVKYQPGDFLFFGNETKGLPMELLEKHWEHAVTIPMTKEGRSLNLAVSVGIVVYEGIRQNFEAFTKEMD